jgi:hypothetical protein
LVRKHRESFPISIAAAEYSGGGAQRYQAAGSTGSHSM